MSITLSRFSMPLIDLCFPAIVCARFNFLASALYKISFTKEDFPDPDTPVTQVITPSGKSTFMFLRLFSAAPHTLKVPVGFLLSLGTGITIFLERYCPVMDFLHFIIAFASPCATTSPP